MTRRRLRSVPEQSTPTIIEPESGRARKRREQYAEHELRRGQSSEWQDGWRACRAQLENEWQAWYRRGLEAQPVHSGAVIGLGLCALSGFVVGFVLAVAVFAA